MRNRETKRDGAGGREYDYRREEGEGSEGSTRSIAVGATAWLVISRSVGKVQSAVGHGRKKGRNARERDPGFTGDGSEGDRGGEAQTGPGLVILRYHVLRITVSVTCARAPACAQCVTLRSVCMYTRCTHGRSQYCSLGIPPSLSFSLPFSSFLTFLSVLRILSLAPSFLSLRTISLSLSIRGRLGRLLFASEELETLSRAHTLEADRLQRVLKYRHTRGTLHGALHTVADLKDAGEVRVGVTTSFFY